MISVSGHNWEELTVNKRILEKFRIDNGFSEIISKLIISRNFDKTEIFSLKNNVELSNPLKNFLDIKKGHDILEKSIIKKDKIYLIGDYDVDGCVATSIFINFFKLINKDVTFFIPNRFSDGYGASLDFIKKIVREKPDLVIMLDCGSNSHDSIRFLNQLNIKTLIIDHHELIKPYPKANSIINPKKDCDYSKFDFFSASTLVYFFLDSFIDKKKLDINFSENLFYVLLSIVSDVMPLRKMNRYICIYVLNNFDFNKNFIVKKIFELKNIKRPLEIEDLGFLIGPILNSAGRLKDCTNVIKLITSDDYIEKEKILKDLLSLNEKRKEIENKVLNEIDFKKIINNNDNIIILKNDFISEGIIGIIASRLKDYFNKPSIVLTKSNNIYKASARSVPIFNIGKYIFNAINKKLLISGGGHNLAAGFNIAPEKINDFINYLNSNFLKNTIKNTKKYVSKISTKSINKDFYNEMNILKPFGSKNEKPLFLIEKVKIIKPKLIKSRYISFFLQSRNRKFLSAISFSFPNSEISKNLLYNKNEMNLLVQIKENFWNNKKTLQLIVKDVIELPNNA